MGKDKPTPYKSRSLIDIERQISEAVDSRKRLVLHARRAALLAQASQTEMARQLVLELREINKAYDTRLTSWIMYTEALIYHAESLDVRGASERLRRAYPFACALKDADLAGSCAAWLAHCYFGLGDHKNIASYIREAFDWSFPDRWNALARASLTLADSLSWCGQYADAKIWYRESRHCAAIDGNVMMQNAAIYNSAAFQTAQMWIRRISNAEQVGAANVAQIEVDSAETFNALVRNTSNAALIPLVRAELSASLGHFESAIAEFDKYLEGGAPDSLSRYDAKVLAEMAWCLAETGQMERSSLCASKALDCVDSCRDFDDLAVIQYCLSQIARIQGDIDRHDYHAEACQVYVGEFQRIQEETRSEISPVSDEFSQKLRTKKSPQNTVGL